MLIPSEDHAPLRAQEGNMAWVSLGPLTIASTDRSQYNKWIPICTARKEPAIPEGSADPEWVMRVRREHVIRTSTYAKVLVPRLLAMLVGGEMTTSAIVAALEIGRTRTQMLLYKSSKLGLVRGRLNPEPIEGGRGKGNGAHEFLWHLTREGRKEAAK